MPVKLKIDGREIEAEKSDLVIRVAADHGIFIPHFCWHPGLPPEGNCRMCLVKTSTSRKLEPACMMRCADGMVVETEVPEVLKARKDVLEFLLANHPLDCPICDKAGECLLQNYTFEWRDGASRLPDISQKQLKPTKDVGPGIRFWGNRCITCTRCVRFLDEVAGTGELSVVNRGDRSTIDIQPGHPVDNPLSLNIVDLCPVGALIDKSFLFSARVWYTRRTESLCAHCSRGCNVTITTLDNRIRRMQPRFQPKVNGYWMCDQGRLYTGYVASDRRLRRRRGSPREVAQELLSIREKHGAGSLAAIVSSYNTCEEIDRFRQIVGALGIETLGFLTLTRGERQVFKSGFAIEADRTPNRRYLLDQFGELAVLYGVNPVISGLMDGKIRGLLVVNGIPDLRYPFDLLEGARRAEFTAVVDILQNPMVDLANVVLPGCAWAEKEGTFVNVDGIPQRFARACDPPGEARPEAETLQSILDEIRAAEPVAAAK